MTETQTASSGSVSLFCFESIQCVPLLLRWLVHDLLALLLHRLWCCFLARLCQRAINGHSLSAGKQGEEPLYLWLSTTKATKTLYLVAIHIKIQERNTCVTIPLMSPVLEGRRMVLDSLASLEKADTYCSATLSEAAAFPFCTMHSKNDLHELWSAINFRNKTVITVISLNNKKSRPHLLSQSLR